jgi:uncharacterized membrane protein
VNANRNLTVWTFTSAEGARRALDGLRRLQRTGEITIQDAAVVEWPPHRWEPETREFYHVDADGQRSCVWRGLFRALFGVDETISRWFRDLGVDDWLLAEVRERIRPETSVLFVVTTGGFIRDLEPSFREFGMTLLYTMLPETGRRRLARRPGSHAHADL